MGDNNVVRFDKYSKKRTGRKEIVDRRPAKSERRFAQLKIVTRCFYGVGIASPFIGIGYVFLKAPVLVFVLVVSFLAGLVFFLVALKIEDWASVKYQKMGKDPDKSGSKDPPDAA